MVLIRLPIGDETMTEIPEYDEAATLARAAAEVHEGWDGLRNLSSSGQKAWLTRMKSHYLRLIQADAEAAAEMLAVKEYFPHLIREHGLPNTINDKIA
jgi:hypothetical protein